MAAPSARPGYWRVCRHAPAGVELYWCYIGHRRLQSPPSLTLTPAIHHHQTRSTLLGRSDVNSLLPWLNVLLLSFCSLNSPGQHKSVCHHIPSFSESPMQRGELFDEFPMLGIAQLLSALCRFWSDRCAATMLFPPLVSQVNPDVVLPWFIFQILQFIRHYCMLIQQVDQCFGTS